MTLRRPEIGRQLYDTQASRSAVVADDSTRTVQHGQRLKTDLSILLGHKSFSVAILKDECSGKGLLIAGRVRVRSKIYQTR